MNILRHNCGWCVTHTLNDAFSFISSLQHRGREAAGIAAIGDKTISLIKWKGLVNRFEVEDLHKVFPRPLYHTYLSHVRYATSGRKDQILNDAQPIGIGGYTTDNGDHLIVENCEAVIVHNGQVNIDLLRLPATTKPLTGSDSEALLYHLLEHGPAATLAQIPGAYSLAYKHRSDKDTLVLRDQLGMKPGILGWKDGYYGAASEDIAFCDNDGKHTEDLDPGSIYYLRPDGSFHKRTVLVKKPRYCFFEWNYLAHVDTILNGVSVRRLREELGAALPFIPTDLVTYLPRCPQVAARHYASQNKLRFSAVFYKTRQERSFQGTTSIDRRHSIKKNLFLLPFLMGSAGEVLSPLEILGGKTVTMIDDSIVRGNNCCYARDLLLQQRQVSQINLLSYTPPIGIIGPDHIPRGCLFGVDMPPTADDFVARNRTGRQINEALGMNVHYLKLAKMLAVYKKMGIPPDHLCTYCLGGPHPFA